MLSANMSNPVMVSSLVSLSLSPKDLIQKAFYDCLHLLEQIALEDGVSSDSDGFKLLFDLKEDQSRPFLFLQISFLSSLGAIKVSCQGDKLYYRLTQLGISMVKHLILENNQNQGGN